MVKGEEENQEIAIDDIGEPILEQVIEEEVNISDFIQGVPVAVKPLKYIHVIAAKRIAQLLVGGFLLLLSAPFFYLFLVVIMAGANQAILETLIPQVLDMLKTVAAVLGGTVGAVTAYYFTAERRER